MENEENRKVSYKYYYEQLKVYAEARKTANQQKILFLQNILLVSASIVGIVISLHTANSQHLYIQVVFLASILLLSLGIVCLVLVLHDFSTLEDKVARKFHDEIQESMKNDVRCSTIYADQKKTTDIFEKCSYYFLLSGFILLISYTGLVEFKKETVNSTKKDKYIEIINVPKIDSLTTIHKIIKHD